MTMKKIKKIYEKFNHYKVDGIEINKKYNSLLDIKGEVFVLGKLTELSYISDKDINDKGIRIKNEYVHKFKVRLPIYTDGKVLVIPLESQELSDRGLIFNKNKKVEVY
jgi:hypothetical protein